MVQGKTVYYDAALIQHLIFQRPFQIQFHKKYKQQLENAF